jgi:hypothetical protein
MRNIIIFVREIVKPTNKKILGRWMIEQCEKKKERMISLANKDYGCQSGFYKISEQDDENDIDTQIRFRYMV